MEQADRGDRAERLGEQDAERGEAEHARREALSQSESGGLSTVMKLPGSSEPKNQAFQLSLPARAAAA